MAFLRQDVSWKRDSNTSQNNFTPTSDPLAIIYNEGLWRINQVTPFFNMCYQPIKLKFYATKVRQGLVSAVQASSTKYTVTFVEQPHLKYSDEDASGLMITVTSSAQDNSKTKVAYSAILLSWGVSKTMTGSVHLPYMLEQGEQRVGTSVKATLQTIFDCHIAQYTFTQHQLLQFGFNLVDNDSSKSTNPFTLVYKTPHVEHKEKLNLSFETGDITIIWNGLKDETSHPSQHVSLTYQMLQNQIFHMIELDITVLELCEVIISKAEVKSSGALKMKTPEMVNCVFTVLNEISNMRDFDISKIYDKENNFSVQDLSAPLAWQVSE